MTKSWALHSLLMAGVFIGGCAQTRTDSSQLQSPGGSPLVRIMTGALPSAQVEAPYSTVVAASGGTAPYSWTVNEGSWPQGVALDGSGRIGGTPAQMGSFPVSLTVRDSSIPPLSATQRLALTVSSSQTAASSSPSYGAGFTAAGLTLNGGAVLDGTRLRLTDSGGAEGRSVFFDTPVNVQSFTSDFSFQLTNADADGFTFAIQGEGATAVGGRGGNLGYAGITRSAAVKFDLYNNVGEGTDSTGLFSNGAFPGLPASEMSSSGVDLHSGDVMNVHITYNGSTLTWTITDPTRGTHFQNSAAVNIPSLVGANTAYVGFTAGTGALTATQDILTWTFASGVATQPVTTTPVSSGAPQITTSELPAGAVGAIYNTELAASSGTPPYTWTVVSGQLPSGLGLQPSTGQIAGTPSQVGTSSLTVQVKDSTSSTARAGFSINVAGSSPLATTPTPGQGLLSGCTINSSNLPSCSIPSGWSLAAAQGFETGSLPSNQSIDSTVNCSFGHSGRCSASALINAQGAADQWFFSQGALVGHEFYLSYYDWAGGGTANEEYVLAHAIKRDVGGSAGFQEIIPDLVSTTTYNNLCPLYVLFFQGNSPSNRFLNGACYFANAWTQWEIWVRANTPGNSDGFVRIFKNGALVVDQENMSPNGNTDMTGMQVEAGGWYTKNDWTNNGQFPPSGSCASGPGQGSEAGSWQGSFNTVGAQNCAPAPPPFTRYIDDIILLQR